MRRSDVLCGEFLGGPTAGDQELKAELQKLKGLRVSGTKPSLPLDRYSGTSASKLYCDLDVTVVNGALHVRFGLYSAALDHWGNDTFYGHAVIEPFLDWQAKFDISDDRSITGLEIIHLGWKEPDERFPFHAATRLRSCAAGRLYG